MTGSARVAAEDSSSVSQWVEEVDRDSARFQLAAEKAGLARRLSHQDYRPANIDAATAERAFQQITAALETLRAAGQASYAKYYEAHLAEVRGIRDRLKAGDDLTAVGLTNGASIGGAILSPQR
jgi:hypothetical protein